jgi:tRNA 2-thiouridine synthesizing protein A
VAILVDPRTDRDRVEAVPEQPEHEVDARDLQCPMPLLKAKRALNSMAVGERLRVLATDQGSVRDFQVFAEQSGHRLINSAECEGIYTHVLEKVEQEA